ncbi:MAG: DNA-binding response regulator [Hydrocarboniphaga sp.]|uniref:response regulator transcription factor n=1 Tax=Hydrocarboniphaga sp. TaxID=2033016 RepID=UPI002604AF1D|nr:response regulator transcription factor [Hydrocarboniphaga sp.]MDB5968272.1 DNA-binding response regulator [Hydrocarboniphaga sp.]
MAKILVVDDDAHIRELVCFALGKAGFATLSAGDGVQALAVCDRERPSLLVLDILMPEMDGTEVCRRLRAAPMTARLPILFLSSRDDEVDRIVGLELGGDDYVAKPFSPRELVARVRALLRRAEPIAIDAAPAQWRHNRLRLDGERYRAWWDEQEIVLTLTEFGILRALITRPGKVCRRVQLMDQAYELHRIVSDRTIDSHVRRVRAKLAVAGADVIETAHGIGYRLGPCE